VQLLDLLGQDRPSATAEDLDVPRALLLQQVVHVLEVLGVPALVARHGDGVRVLLDRGVHHILHAAVVPQVDHLGAGALDDPPHDVDGGIVAIEERGGGDDADLVLGDVGGAWTKDMARIYQFGATDDFSIECNVKMPATWAGDPVFVGNKDWDNGNNPGFVLSTTGTGFNWKFNLGDGTDRVDLTGLPINDGEWHHLAVTCDRDGEARIFQDGLLMGSADMSAIGDVNTAFPICFGQDGTTTYGSALTGTVSGVRIWRKALDINTVSAWSGKPISALHPDVTFLIGEWPMNEGTGGLLTNAVTLQEDAQFYNGANAVDATWMSNTTPLTTTDLTRTPTQADVVPTILEYLCITEYTDWPLDGQPLIEGCVSTAVEERASNSVLLFPNPSRDRITIRSSKANGLFILSDATGRSVMTTKLIGTSTTIGIDHLPTGPYQYVLRALDGQVQERGMLVKQ
jgi:hypothetical protein